MFHPPCRAAIKSSPARRTTINHASNTRPVPTRFRHNRAETTKQTRPTKSHHKTQTQKPKKAQLSQSSLHLQAGRRPKRPHRRPSGHAEHRRRRAVPGHGERRHRHRQDHAGVQSRESQSTVPPCLGNKTTTRVNINAKAGAGGRWGNQGGRGVIQQLGGSSANKRRPNK